MDSLPFRFYIFLAVLFVLGLPKAYAAGGVVVADLTDKWMIYDKEGGGYLPFLPSEGVSRRSYHLFLSTIDAPNGSLQIDLRGLGEVDVYINNRLERHGHDEILVLPLNTFAVAPLLITVFQAEKSFPPPAVKVLSAQGNFVSELAIAPLESFGTRGKVRAKLVPSSLIVYAVFLFTAFAVFSKVSPSIFNYREVFSSFEGIGKMAGRQSRLSGLDFIPYFLYSVLSNAFMMATLYLYEPAFYVPDILSVGSMKAGFSNLFLSSILIVCAVLLLKIFLVLFIGQVYQVRYLTKAHFQEMIRFGQFYNTIFLSIALFMCMVVLEYPVEEMVFGICGLFILKSLLVSYRIIRQLSIKKVFIISYFCGTEFIPVIFTIEFFTGF